jgi:8-oxo-dGTP pyrophosphatase MutT (NUDIX family)
MTRKETILLLERYLPTDPHEQKFKKEMLAFMCAHENCFERSLEMGHITASSWLLNKKGDKALLTHHAKLNRWFQLGGHCDGDPHVLAVAIKEAQEESGICAIKPLSTAIFDIDIHLIPENKKEKAHYHYDIRFLLQVHSDDAVQVSEESHALAWFGNDPTTLPPVDRSVLRMFYKWVEKRT